VLFVKTLSGSLDGHAAADIAQTAFERALPRWPTLRYPKAWLYRMAHNEAMARIAALQREMPTEVLPDRPDEALAPAQRQVMTWS
jgi:DNA-directed RNA polymerase specialized sigma24 family protein